MYIDIYAYTYTSKHQNTPKNNVHLHHTPFNNFYLEINSHLKIQISSALLKLKEETNLNLTVELKKLIISNFIERALNLIELNYKKNVLFELIKLIKMYTRKSRKDSERRKIDLFILFSWVQIELKG